MASMTLFSHLQFLERQMASVRHLPTLFEYHAALHHTKLHQTRFYAYQDIPLSHKRDAGFPLSDKGIDLIDETFRHIVQVKYYGPRMKLHYGQLSTFLATPLLVGRRHLRLTLVRTNHCKIHSDIHQMVQRGDLSDVTLCQRSFLKSIRR